MIHALSRCIVHFEHGQTSLTCLHRDLHTNLPKELMAFPDFPFPESERSFVHHSEVRTYLEQYAAHFSLEKVLVGVLYSEF